MKFNFWNLFKEIPLILFKNYYKIIYYYIKLYYEHMKFIVSKNIYTMEVINVYKTMAEAAKDMNVDNNSIRQAIVKNGKCKNYYWKFIEIDDKKILNLINDNR